MNNSAGLRIDRGPTRRFFMRLDGITQAETTAAYLRWLESLEEIPDLFALAIDGGIDIEFEPTGDDTPAIDDETAETILDCMASFLGGRYQAIAPESRLCIALRNGRLEEHLHSISQELPVGAFRRWASLCDKDADKGVGTNPTAVFQIPGDWEKEKVIETAEGYCVLEPDALIVSLRGTTFVFRSGTQVSA